MRHNLRFIALALTFAWAATGNAQEAASVRKTDGKVRAFISDSNSWEMSGGFGGSQGGFGGASTGGARPQTAEIIKTFGQRCPQVTVTINRDRADYVVLLDHEGGKSAAKRDNKIAVFGRDGDSIFSSSTRSLGNAVKDACEAIMSNHLRPR